MAEMAAPDEDEELRRLCKERPIGAAEQHIDSTDVLERPEAARRTWNGKRDAGRKHTDGAFPAPTTLIVGPHGPKYIANRRAYA